MRVIDLGPIFDYRGFRHHCGIRCVVHVVWHGAARYCVILISLGTAVCGVSEARRDKGMGPNDRDTCSVELRSRNLGKIHPVTWHEKRYICGIRALIAQLEPERSRSRHAIRCHTVFCSYMEMGGLCIGTLEVRYLWFGVRYDVSRVILQHGATQCQVHDTGFALDGKNEVSML